MKHRTGFILAGICVVFLLLQGSVFAQLEQEAMMKDSINKAAAPMLTYPNTTAGEVTPSQGFLLVKTKVASLNISLYSVIRYLNQLPGEQTWEDHRGRQFEFTGRRDIYWHRAMIWFSGFLLTPKLTYTSTVWTIFTTQQTLVYGNLRYFFNKHFVLTAGIIPNVAVRSLQGPFPYYQSTDRTLGEESLRPGFTGGIMLKGELIPKLSYVLMLGNNLSILGVQAAKLTRTLSHGYGLLWMPTTGEYGPRGGLIDFEDHEKPATRFGINYTHCRDNRFNNTGQPAPDNTQVRMTDGVLFFETGALADGVTVQEADYDFVVVDAGVKYKGFNLQLEFYNRMLSDFSTDGPVPINYIQDLGYSIQASYMVKPKVLALYGYHSYFFDEFKRHPWELGAGVNIYPMKSRSWRLNIQAHHVYKSSAGGSFGLYNAGQTGTTITIGTDFLL